MGMRSDGPSLFLPTAKKPFDFVAKTVGGDPFCIPSTKFGRAGSVRPSNPSRSHRRCARKARTDVRVHCGKNLSSQRKFQAIIS